MVARWLVVNLPGCEMAGCLLLKDKYKLRPGHEKRRNLMNYYFVISRVHFLVIL